MKSPAKKFVSAIILGAVLFNAGLLFAQNNLVKCTDPEIKIYSSQDEESAERKREFWEKFRESVTPREKNPPQEVNPGEAPPPKEITPGEAPPPKEVNP